MEFDSYGDILLSCNNKNCSWGTIFRTGNKTSVNGNNKGLSKEKIANALGIILFHPYVSLYRNSIAYFVYI